MKYKTIRVVRSNNKCNYYFPALKRYLLKDWVDNAWNFYKGLGEVQKGGRWYKVDKKGTRL